MAKGRKTGGRKKGTPNKATASMRDAWLQAFDALGGADGLTRWAKRSPDRFYALASRLIPPAKPEPDSEPENGIPSRIEIHLVDPVLDSDGWPRADLLPVVHQ